jgi:hypothetical protein
MPQSQGSKQSLTDCTIKNANKLTVGNFLSHTLMFGNFFEEGSWGRTTLDAFGGGNTITDDVSAGRTFFGSSGSGRALAQAGVALVADPSMGLNPVLERMGAAIPSAVDVLEHAAAGSAAETLSGIGLAKFGYDAVTAAGSFGYCLATQ